MMRKESPVPEGTLMIGATRSRFTLWSLFAVAGLMTLSVMAIFSSTEGWNVRIVGLVVLAVLLPLLAGGMFDWVADSRLFLLENGLVLRRWSSDTAIPFSEVRRICWTRGSTGQSITIAFKNQGYLWMKAEGQGGQLARRVSALSGVPIDGL